MKSLKKMFFLLVAVIFCCLSCTKQSEKPGDKIDPSSIANAGAGLQRSSLAASGFKVIGYLPTWSGAVNDIQFSKLTHVNYAFLIPTSTGGYQSIENPGKLSDLVSAAHSHQVKVLISVGGGGGGNAFHSIVANSSYRTNFVNSMIAFTDQYNLDGVDVDWEYPGISEANNFYLLMQELASAMHSRGKLASIAVIANNDGNTISGNLFSVLDYIQIMAYDDNNYQHSTYSSAVNSLHFWLNRGLPASKAILGVPFYGRDNRYDYATKNYNELLDMGASPNADTWSYYGYNGIPTIRSKTQLALDEGGGIMMWELSGDATGSASLLSAIDDVVQNGNSQPGNTPPIGQVIALKGFNGKYVSGENGTDDMHCDRVTAQSWEHFTVIDAGNGQIALRSMGKYVSSENGTQPITCNRAAVGDWEKFTWEVNPDGTVFLKGNNGKYISSENGTQAMTCNRTTPSGWEAFTVN